MCQSPHPSSLLTQSRALLYKIQSVCMLQNFHVQNPTLMCTLSDMYDQLQYHQATITALGKWVLTRKYILIMSCALEVYPSVQGPKQSAHSCPHFSPQCMVRWASCHTLHYGAWLCAHGSCIPCIWEIWRMRTNFMRTVGISLRSALLYRLRLGPVSCFWHPWLHESLLFNQKYKKIKQTTRLRWEAG